MTELNSAELAFNRVINDPQFNAMRLCISGDLGLSKVSDPLYGFSSSQINDGESARNAELGQSARRGKK